MLLLIFVSLLSQETEDYFPLKPGMTWEFENVDGKKIGDREYRLVRNALVGTPPERDIPAVASAGGVTLFDEHDQVNVCGLKRPAKPGAEWTPQSRVGRKVETPPAREN